MGQTVSHQYGGIYGPAPQMTYCPKCDQYTLTRVNYVMGHGVWSSCSFLLIWLSSAFCFHSFFCRSVLICGRMLNIIVLYAISIGKFVREYEDHRYGGRTVVVVQPPIPPRQPQVQPVILASAPPVHAYTPPTSPPPYPR